MGSEKESSKKRVFLSPPHVAGQEEELLLAAFRSNWIAPVGPYVDQFEGEFSDVVGCRYAVAVSSGTAALHLLLRDAGIGAGDEVAVSTLTFVGSVGPILYQNARPVFLDSDPGHWNIDANLLEDLLRARSARNRLPKALVAVHLYGQPCPMADIQDLCEQFGVLLIEDAAEALGSKYDGKLVGGLGNPGIFSFNGNKIITTSGGGMITTDRKNVADHARKLATQSRDPAPHYEHSEIGFNYRMSNLLAAVGLGQLRTLQGRVDARRQVAHRYQEGLGDLPGVCFLPEIERGFSNRWLTVLTIDPAVAGTDREQVRLALQEENIEARPVWKPMHLQPALEGFEVVGGRVSERIFELGLCLPSGSGLRENEQRRVMDTVRSLWP